MSEASLESVSYRELRSRCKELGLRASGKREQLLTRIEEYYNEHPDERDDDVEEEEEEEENNDELPEEEEEDAAALMEEAEIQDGEADDDDDDDDDDDEENDDDDDGDEVLEFPEIVGVLARRRSLPEDDDEDDDEAREDVMFIPAQEFAEAFKSGAFFDEEDDDNDDDDADELADLFSGPNHARLVCTILSAVEAFTFLVLLIYTGEVTASDGNTNFANATTTGTTELLKALADKVGDIDFWSVLVGYFFILVVLPTLAGLLMGKYKTADSVLGYAVCRASLWYIMKTHGWTLILSPALQPLFNVTCIVSVIMAFWDRQL